MPSGPITIFSCSRGSTRASCKVCHARAVVSCGYELRGRLAGKECDTPLCETHKHTQRTGQHFCLVHHEIEQRKAKEAPHADK